MEILLSLGIIIPIAILGFFSRKAKIISTNNSRALSSFIYYFALPSLFISKIANIKIQELNINIITGSVLPILFVIIFLYFLKIFKILNKNNFILLSLSVAFGSNAFFGIPFFENFAGDPGLQFSIITSSILGPLGIILSILLFEYANKKNKGLEYVKKIILNPLILSIFLGIIFSLTNFNDNFLIQSFDLLGKAAGPVAIFTLGIFIYDNFSIKAFKQSILFSLSRLILLPLVAFIIIYTFNIGGNAKDYLIIQTGIPAAISLAVFAKRYNFQVALISNIVIITSLFSVISLSILSFLT